MTDVKALGIDRRRVLQLSAGAARCGAGTSCGVCDDR